MNYLELGISFNQQINNFILCKKKNENYSNQNLKLRLGCGFYQPIVNESNIPLEIIFIDNYRYKKIPNVIIHHCQSYD